MPGRGNSLEMREKLQILEEVISQEQNGKPNFTSIGKKFNVDRTTVARISKGRDNLQKRASEGRLSQKRKRRFKDEDIDEALSLWIKEELPPDSSLNLPILRAKATQLAQEMEHPFVPNDSWLTRFKERNSLKFKTCKKVTKGQKSTDYTLALVAASKFVKEEVPQLLLQYDKENIYNASETGLYFKSLPDCYYAPFKEQLSSEKEVKERVTVLVCANMSGSDKKNLVVVGKAKSPKCFPQDIFSLPVVYRTSSSALMTSVLFQEFMEEWNRALQNQDRRVVVLLDSCTAHSSRIGFSNIKIIFLPPNTKSSTQPMDMGIIKNLKGHYRKKVNERITAVLNVDSTKKPTEAVKEITLCDAVYMLKDAWSEVTQGTIITCFAKAGFKDPMCSESESQSVTEEYLLPPHNLTPAEFEVIINQDADLEVCGTLTNAEIVAQVKKQKSGQFDNDSDGEEDQEPTSQELLSSINSLRYMVQKQGDMELMEHFKPIEKTVHKALHQRKTKAVLDAFFEQTATDVTPDAQAQENVEAKTAIAPVPPPIHTTYYSL